MCVKTNHQMRVEQFMEQAEAHAPAERKGLQLVLKMPTVPPEAVRMLRAKLIISEALETVRALGIDLSVQYTGVGADGYVPVFDDILQFSPNPTRAPDLEQIADGCADISVVTIGTLSACGICDEALLREVDRSNLDKFRGDAYMNADGKWVKPSDWVPPRILNVLEDQVNPVETT